MKTFYGGIFIEKRMLEEAKIYYPIKLEYYKIENEKEKYGIEVVKTEYSKEEVLVEKEIFEEITEDEKEVNNILDLFKRNNVTPISANEILEDLLLDMKF